MGIAPPVPVPPAGQITAGTATSLVKARRTRKLTWKPLGNTLTPLPNTYFDVANGGRAFLLAIELEDAFDMVQLKYATQLATDTYTVQLCTVAPSSSYGVYHAPGVTPLDPGGNPYTALLPVTFNSGGAYKDPWLSLPQSAGATATTDGCLVLPITSSAAQAAGIKAISVTNITPGSIVAQHPLVAGWYVQDGAGSFPSGTTLQSFSGSTITVSAATTKALVQGQTIYVSPVPITLSFLVPPNTNPIEQQWINSDWVPCSSHWRNDGGYPVGASVAGANIAAGTTITAIAPRSITLSTGLTGAMSASTPLTISTTTTATEATSVNLFDIFVADLSKISKGAIVTVTSGTGVLPANAYVDFKSAQTGPGTIRVAVSRLGVAPTTGISAGDTLQFTWTAYTDASSYAAGAQQIGMISTSGKPLLLIRGTITAAAGSTVATSNYSSPVINNDADNGFGFMCGALAPNNADGVNVPGLLSNLSCSPNFISPIYAVSYITRQPGIQISEHGDSTHAGYSSSASFAGSAARAAAQVLSGHDMPVSHANFGYAGQASNSYGPMAAKFMAEQKPSIAILGIFSGNAGPILTTDMVRIGALADYARSLGVLPILAPHTVYGMPNPGTLVVAEDVTNATFVPITEAIGFGSVSGIAVTSPGFSGTLIANEVLNTIPYGITFTTPVTLAAGTKLYTNGIQTTGGTNATTFALSTPCPLYQVIYNVTWPGGPAGGAGATVNFGATTVTLNGGPYSIPAGTVLTFSYVDPAPGYTQASLSAVRDLISHEANGTELLYDMYALFADPVNGGYREDLSQDGLHPNKKASLYSGTTMAPGTMLSTIKQAVGTS